MSTTARAYLTLTKPGITTFVGITAGAAFVTARGAWDRPVPLALTVAATMLMSAGAAAANQIAEHAEDGRMRRTASRPIPSGRITLRAARMFALVLTLAGFAIALLWLGALPALFLALCHVSYVNIYTPLKRQTPLCTLAGAIPGALPVLAGWTATGEAIDVTAIALTGVLFMWQIPHFLAIGWMARDDYRTAGCPMLGVLETSGRSSARISFAYACATLFCAVIAGVSLQAGVVYMAPAVIACSGYAALAWRFVGQRERAPARHLFFSSLIVLPVVLMALIADISF
jgi:protoheme IX farnesyltransferase